MLFSKNRRPRPYSAELAEELCAEVVIGELLLPVNAANPAGASLEYDNEFAVMQARLLPKSDVQYGSFESKPEAPDWVSIERESLSLLHRSKDIAVMVSWARARTRQGGAQGLLQGLANLRALLDTFADQVHPQLVIDGVADPAVRANALAALCDPEGLLSDVREVLVSSSTAYRLGIRDVERALAVPRLPYAMDIEVVRRQLQDLYGRADPFLYALLAARHCAHQISQWCSRTLGEDAPDLSALLKLMDPLASMTLGDTSQSNATLPEQADQSSAAAVALSPLQSIDNASSDLPMGLSMVNNTVAQQREQMRQLLEQARQWIEQHEPSSPVSILLKQALRMWGKRFSEVANMIPPELLQAWDKDD